MSAALLHRSDRLYARLVASGQRRFSRRDMINRSVDCPTVTNDLILRLVLDGRLRVESRTCRPPFYHLILTPQI